MVTIHFPKFRQVSATLFRLLKSDYRRGPAAAVPARHVHTEAHDSDNEDAGGDNDVSAHAAMHPNDLTFSGDLPPERSEEGWASAAMPG
jgi:hypothetical protein